MKILAAEDNPVFQAMLNNLLRKWDYEVTLARDGGQAWSILQSDDPPRLAILDWMMPGLDGVEICRRVRGAGREPYVYILLLTARTQAEDLVEGMEAGADDYLTKPFNAHELRVRLRAGRRIVDLQEELLQTREALRIQATHDGLTGLWNRTRALELLEKELARSTREKFPLAVLMVDIDHFKKINDTYGHQAGDAVLRETARRMGSVVRPYDSLGRYGGEEFLLVLPGCQFPDVVAQAERVRLAIASQPFEVPDGSITVTCSIGVSWSEGRGIRSKSLLSDADQALYVAKNAGRNRIETCAPVNLVTC